MVFEPGTAVILHPTVFAADLKNSFYRRETYSVTPAGYKRLHQSTDELLTVQEGS
jgi:hypothetical protein